MINRRLEGSKSVKPHKICLTGGRIGDTGLLSPD